MTVTRFSKIAGVLKSIGNSTHDVFKLTRHASFSCESGKSVPLSLPLMINSDDICTIGGDVSHDGDDVVPTTTDVVVTVRLVVEETSLSTLGMYTVRLFSL